MVFLPIKDHDSFIFVPTKSKTTIPCRVTNPNTTVTLHEKANDEEIPYPYDNKKGFTGRFDDTNYYCKASQDGTEVNSDHFYIYTIDGNIAISILCLQKCNKNASFIFHLLKGFS